MIMLKLHTNVSLSLRGPFSVGEKIIRGNVRDGTSGTGVRVFSPRFQPAAGEIFFEERILRKF